MANFATLAWECAPNVDHGAVHFTVLAAIEAAGVSVLDTPLGDSTAPDTSMVVFRYAGGVQLTDVVKNLKTIAISFVLTTSTVGNTKACSSDINKNKLEKVTG